LHLVAYDITGSEGESACSVSDEFDPDRAGAARYISNQLSSCSLVKDDSTTFGRAGDLIDTGEVRRDGECE
jgi:hypothetical protein